MNGCCDKCGKLIINDTCVYDLVNGKIVGMLCLDCDEERERLKDGDERSEAVATTKETENDNQMRRHHRRKDKGRDP